MAVICPIPYFDKLDDLRATHILGAITEEMRTIIIEKPYVVW
jgi:hypothetical protein